MSNTRTYNTVRNVISSIVNRIVGILVPFILRTAMIKVLGEQYLGLSSLFSSILQVLNLADLGFSSAIVFNMYKPIAEGDDETICALLNLYKKIYRVIGLIILAVGLCLLPFLDNFISGDYPDGLNLQVLYLMYLANTVMSYLLFAHRRSLIYAFQRIDIERNVNTILELVLDAVKIVLLFVFKNYYLYVIFTPLMTFLSGLIIAIISYKQYPQYRCKGKVSKNVTKEIVKRVSGLSIQKFGNTISTSLDSMVISSFLGLSLLAIYSNYIYIVNAIIQFIWACISSATASLGNSIVTESVDKNYLNFKKIDMLNQWAICWCTPCFLCLYQHFMVMWVGEDLTAGMDLVVLMVIYFLIAQTRKVVMVFKDACGMWWADKWKPLVGGLFNLALNIILVQTIGMDGVILSTIASYLLIEFPWETHVLFKNYFNRSEFGYYIQILKYLIVTIIGSAISWGLCSLMPETGIVFFLIKATVCFAIANVVFYVVFGRSSEYKHLVGLAIGTLKKIIKK